MIRFINHETELKAVFYNLIICVFLPSLWDVTCLFKRRFKHLWPSLCSVKLWLRPWNPDLQIGAQDLQKA